MTRRIQTRPHVAIPLLAVWVVAGLFGVFLMIATLARAPELGPFYVLLEAVWVVFGWVTWRRSHIPVGIHGVGAGLWRRRWLPWSEVRRFRRDDINPRSAAIFADLENGETVFVGGVPFQPLFFDTVEKHGRAVARLLEQLEAARPDSGGRLH
jgi:hypothetical protein